MSEKFLGSEIKKLGFGMMRLPMLEDNTIDVEQTKKMVDLYMEKGFTYFDTAYPYLDGHSEEAVKASLTSRYPRDSYQLATKLPVWLVNAKEDVAKIFNTQLERTGAGYFDFYLLHAIDRNKALKYDEYDTWEFIKEQKEKGLIKHYGFSFHDTADCLDDILQKHPDAEFVQLQINYCDWDDSIIQAKKCYEVARKHNKPVIIMEPVKGGTLAALTPELDEIFKKARPDHSVASWALRFAASLEGVITVLSGMSNMEQMEDNLSFMAEFEKITDEDQKVIDDVTDKLKNMPLIPCTNCQYCMEVCPQQIPIPEIFKAMNKNATFKNLEDAKNEYGFVTGGCSKASDCLQCGACEAQCPQHIEIITELQNAAQMFE